MRFRPFLSSVCVTFGFVTSLSGAQHTRDSLETVKKMVSEKKAILVDVRETSEWNEGHLQDAVHIPLSKIKKGLSTDELTKLTGEDKVIYLHCLSGARCLDAAKRLSNTKRDLRPLEGGFDDLLKAGFPKAK